MAKKSSSETERQCWVSPGAWEESRQMPELDRGAGGQGEPPAGQGGWNGGRRGTEGEGEEEVRGAMGPQDCCKALAFIPSQVGGTGEL